MNLIHYLNKSSEFIFDYLSDMQKFVTVNPVIDKIEPLGDKQYKVYETLKIGFIPYSFTYPATIESNAELKTVTIKATVMKMVHIDIRFSIQPDGSSSIVEEEIHFRSFLPVKAMMGPIFKKQHAQLFLNIGLVAS